MVDIKTKHTKKKETDWVEKMTYESGICQKRMRIPAIVAEHALICSKYVLSFFI